MFKKLPLTYFDHLAIFLLYVIPYGRMLESPKNVGHKYPAAHKLQGHVRP